MTGSILAAPVIGRWSLEKPRLFNGMFAIPESRRQRRPLGLEVVAGSAVTDSQARTNS